MRAPCQWRTADQCSSPAWQHTGSTAFSWTVEGPAYVWQHVHDACFAHVIDKRILERTCQERLLLL